MAPIQNVALIGKGLLGTAVLNQLVAANYTVTLLTRSASSLSSVPKDVKVLEVDYTSVSSLVPALSNIHAIVNTVSATAIPLQRTIIDAAITAGVRRYIPADFSGMSADPSAHYLPVYSTMVDIQNYLKDKAAKGEISYTLYQTGGFLEWLIDPANQFFADVKGKKVVLYDEGRHPFSVSSLDTIGKAIAGGLRKEEETKDKVVYVEDCQVSQAQLVELAKKYTGGEEAGKWEVEKVDAKGELDRCVAEVGKGNFEWDVMVGMLKAGIFGGMFESAYKRNDNELLGVKGFEEGQLEKRFAEYFKEK